MPPVLALYEDVVSNGAALALPAAARMIFLVHGGARIGEHPLRDGETWHGEAAVTIIGGDSGATFWRYELAAKPAPTAEGVRSREMLTASLTTLTTGALLMRVASVE